MSQKSQKAENKLPEIILTILIPVMILNKLTGKLGAVNALLLALAFPLTYMIWDLLKKRKWNWISFLGLVNVMVNGALTLLGLGGIWFAVKEAFFPGIIGIFVFYSANTSRPFLKTFLLNPQFMNIEKIDQRIEEKGAQNAYSSLIKRGTQWLSASFFLSAFLNFTLAQRIFVELDSQLSAEQKSEILNKQLATMMTWSFAVIVVPSIICMMTLLWFILKNLQKITDMTTDEILTPEGKEPPKN